MMYEMPKPSYMGPDSTPLWSEAVLHEAYALGREDFREAVKALLLKLHEPNIGRHNDYLVALNNVERLV